MAKGRSTPSATVCKTGRRQKARCQGGLIAQDGDGAAVPKGREAGAPRGRQPQIAKAEGDSPVQAYIAALPGWKRDVVHRLDALVVRAVPGVRKAVKWNSPLYGVGDQGWFLGVHCLTKYVKVAFFRGTSLHPVPPASPRARTRATSISMRTTLSMKLS